MIAVRIAPDLRIVVVGSPAYFACHAPPRKPEEITAHDCIGMRLPTHGGLLHWEFTRRGKTTNVRVAGRLVFNSGELIVAAVLAGLVLAWVPGDLVAKHIASGRLVSVLDDWARSYAGYHLYYASRNASPAVSLVIDALRPAAS
jgi:DNA-binding transcriptional LysR family regulator